MSRLKPSAGGVTARCQLTTLLLVAFLAFAFSGIAQAQTHGSAVGIACTEKVRDCSDNASCSDNDLCTADTCDTTYPNQLDCVYSVANDDGFGDTLTLLDAYAEVKAVVPFDDPAAPPPVITQVLGDTTNCVLGSLPLVAPFCQLGPGDPDQGIDPGKVLFAITTYTLLPADSALSFLPVEANFEGTDDCDQGGCTAGQPWSGAFQTTAEVVDSCSSGPKFDCSDLDDLCGTYECDPTGSGPDNCDILTAVTATTICRQSAGLCDVAESCDGINASCPGDAKVSATTECRADGGLCDVAESCDGINNDCPADAKVSATTECRADGGICDVAESCDGINDACPADAKVSATTECRADGGICDVAESCDGINDDCPADAKVSATTECRPDAGECDVPESCDGINDACPVDGFEPPGTSCTDDGNDDCFEPLCDDAGNCTQDNEILPPPDFCIADEICRTPGFWKTRGGDERNRPPGNITQAVIDGAGGLDVCGFRITTTAVYPEAGWEESALEAMCISVKGVKQRQLIRQLTAAALNCEISGGAGDCSQFHQDLIFDCNILCDANSDQGGMQDCIDAIDDFNNGLDAGGTCNDSGDFCYDVGDCTGQLDTRCEPNDNCHDRSLCPDEEDGPIDGSDYCFGGGPTSSTGACKAASKNGKYLPATP